MSEPTTMFGAIPDPNATPIALLQYRQEQFEKNLKSLTDTVTGMAHTAQVVNSSLMLMQDHYNRLQRTQEEHEQVIQQVNMDRGNAKSIWWFVGTIGGAAVALVGLLAGAVELFRHIAEKVP